MTTAHQQVILAKERERIAAELRMYTIDDNYTPLPEPEPEPQPEPAT